VGVQLTLMPWNDSTWVKFLELVHEAKTSITIFMW
jgi:hypothetical protein